MTQILCPFERGRTTPSPKVITTEAKPQIMQTSSGNARYQPPVDLNQLQPNVYDDWEVAPAPLRTAEFDNVARVQVYFEGIEQKLIELIKRWPAFTGAVAWLNNFNVLDAMKGKSLGIVVQKEDVLRPDDDKSGDWGRKLRTKLEATYMFGTELRGNLLTVYRDCRLSDMGPMSAMVGTVCVGINEAPGDRNSRPNMHNKFLVFGDFVRRARTSEDEANDLPLPSEGVDNFYDVFKPRAVWTGSYNISNNANRSLENGVYIEDERVALMYYKQWGEIFLLGEALDWNKPWSGPVTRLGRS